MRLGDRAVAALVLLACSHAFAVACSSFESAPSNAPLDASSDTAAPPAGDPGLVARWRFEEESGILAVDSSGNARDGQLNAGASRTEGAVGRAVLFDRARFGNVTAKIPGAGTSSISALAWVKSVDTVSVQSRIVGSGSLTDYWFINLGKGAPFVEARTTEFYWGVGPGNHASIADDRWHHVAAVIDRPRRESRLYVDGTVVALAEPEARDAGGSDAGDTFGDPAVLREVTVGSQGPKVEIAFGGAIDELSIYYRVLDPAEIAAHARRP
jgi:hypothetical protein